MARLNITPIPLEKFKVAKGKIVSFASDLNFRGFSRIYDDAADVGIAIRSHHTGKVVTFVFSREERCNEDVVAWHLVPLNKKECPKYSVVIFNT